VNVRSIENGGDGADSGGSGGEDLVEVIQVYAADGKPGDGNVGGGPANVVECDGLSGGFRAGGEDGTDGDVVRAGGDGALGLGGGVGAEADEGSRD